MSIVDVNEKDFLVDGEPFQIISGGIHYFRVVPEYWEDRLQKLKACGFNTVETYIPWNLHEPRPGEFDFSGIADVVRFIRTAEVVGLYVIIRPSPFICAEWEFGGLPAWLLADPDMRLRCSYPPFLEKVDAYYDVLLAKLKPLLCTNGGPIIMMQVENEYGSYGNDTAYLQHLQQSMRDRGMDVLLFTSDGPEDFMLQGGMIPGVLETVNFGSRPHQAFAKLQEYQPDKPLMCMEFWNGWFDHWGEDHHTRDADDVAQVLDEMLAMGASVNFYMFHGGTNFGFSNGANCPGLYQPTCTSYDYDVLLNEHGEPTEKFYAVRAVIAKYRDLGPLQLPESAESHHFGRVEMTQQAPLFASLDLLGSTVSRPAPEPMEKLGQNDGFILYETSVSGPRAEMPLTLQHVHDRALVYVNEQYQGVVERWGEQALPISIPAEGARLKILVENMGRVNYGPYLKDAKGVTEGIRLGQQFLFGWTITSLPLDDLSNLAFGELAASETPAFYKGTFDVETHADTFLELPQWTKGVVYVNGFNLGRYWEIGPQKTLYVPAPILQAGANEIIVFELNQTTDAAVNLCDTPILRKKMEMG